MSAVQRSFACEYKDRRYHDQTWYVGKSSDVQMGPQDTIMSTLKDDETPVQKWKLHTDNTDTIRRLFTNIETTKLTNLLTNDHNLFEILVPHRKYKVYFDIEKQDCDIDACKAAINNMFPNANMQISGYTTPEKNSYHIVLSNYTVDFKNLELLKGFTNDNKDLGFDPAVYTKYRPMKCINQSKPKREAQRFIEGSTTISKHLIQYDFDDETTDITTIAALDVYKSAYGNNVKTIDPIVDIPHFKALPPEDLNWHTSSKRDLLYGLPLDSDENRIPHKTMMIIMRWSKFTVKMPFEEYWGWASQKGDTLERKTKYLKLWDEAKYACNDAFIKGIYALRFPEVVEEKSLAQFRASMTLDMSKVKMTKGKYYTSNDIAWYRWTVLTGTMGSNKTGATVDKVISYVEQHPEARVLWITPRIALSHNTRHRLDEKGIKFFNYKDEKQKAKLNDKQFLICSPFSIHHLSSKYDIVIVDESETVFRDMLNEDLHTTKFNDNQAKNFQTLYMVLTTSKHNFFLDAFTTRLTLDVVDALRKEGRTGILQYCDDPIQIVQNKWGNRRSRRISFLLEKDEEFNSEKVWMDMILSDLRAGKKLYIYVPRKDIRKGSGMSVQSLAEKLAFIFDWDIGRQIKRYHGDITKLEERDLLDPAESWNNDQVRVVIANGKISVGVNHDTPDVFDKIYAWYEDWVPVRDFFQALHRIRHPKDREMTVYLCAKKPKYGTPKERVVHATQETKLIYDVISAAVHLEKRAQDLVTNKKFAGTRGVLRLFAKHAHITVVKTKEYLKEFEPDLIQFMEHENVSSRWDNIDLLTWLPDEDEAEPTSYEEILERSKFFFEKEWRPVLGQKDETDFVATAWDLKLEPAMKKWRKCPADNPIKSIMQRENFALPEYADDDTHGWLNRYYKLVLTQKDFDAVKTHVHMYRQPKKLDYLVFAKILNIFLGKDLIYQERSKEEGRSKRKKLEGAKYVTCKFSEAAVILAKIWNV